MKNKNIEDLIRPNIASLCPYSTARDDFKGNLGIFLDANESPYPTGYNRYPDPHQQELKRRIGEVKGVDPVNIFLGNGSDEAIDLVFRVFCIPGKDNVVGICPSYGMYEVAAAMNDIERRPVMLDTDFNLDADEVLAACDSNTKAIFICSPNNPSGNAFPEEAILDIVRRAECMVVVDEAYIDFSGRRGLRDRVEEYPNLIILQTMSKAWGLAGLRLGLAFASKRCIQLMSMVKYPYNINQATQKLAMEALEKDIDSEVKEIIEERKRIEKILPEFPFIEKVFSSDANFILVRTGDADSLYGHLIGDGIIVRNRNRVPLCKGCLRITIGLKAENNALIESLKSYKV